VPRLTDRISRARGSELACFVLRTRRVPFASFLAGSQLRFLQRRLIPSCEHLTRKVPTVHPILSAISSALRPSPSQRCICMIAVGVNFVRDCIAPISLTSRISPIVCCRAVLVGSILCGKKSRRILPQHLISTDPLQKASHIAAWLRDAVNTRLQSVVSLRIASMSSSVFLTSLSAAPPSSPCCWPSTRGSPRSAPGRRRSRPRPQSSSPAATTARACRRSTGSGPGR
jgi:hypothetical protein